MEHQTLDLLWSIGCVLDELCVLLLVQVPILVPVCLRDHAGDPLPVITEPVHLCSSKILLYCKVSGFQIFSGLAGSVVDPDPVGSKIICRIRIRNY